MQNQVSISALDAADESYNRIVTFMSYEDIMDGRIHAVRLAALLRHSDCIPSTTHTVQQENIKRLQDNVAKWCFDKSLHKCKAWWHIYIEVTTLCAIHYNTGSVIEKEQITYYFSMLNKLLHIKFTPGIEIHNHHLLDAEHQYNTTIIKSNNHHG